MRSTSEEAKLHWTDAGYALRTGALVGSVTAALGFLVGMVLFLAR
jgi:hypothetical protein